MSVTEGGITYGCSNELEDLAHGIADAGRDLEQLLKSGGALPKTYTIHGKKFNVTGITGLATNGTTSSQTALAAAVSASRGGTPTLLVLPPNGNYYRYSAELTFSANTYLVGYGAKIKPMGLRNTRINMKQGSTGMFGVLLHSLPGAMSRWPERFESNRSAEPAKDGSVAKGDSGSAHCWIQIAGGQDYILKDVHTRGSLVGALRAYSPTNVLIEDCSAMRTHSDSFHIVHDSSFVTCRRVRIIDSGDDGISFVQYDNPKQPRNMLVEDCHMKGGRARGFTVVGGKDTLYLDCIVEDCVLAAYRYGPEGAPNALDSVTNIITRNCEAWRNGRKQAAENASGGFAALISTGDLSCTGIRFENCRGYTWDSDYYDGGSFVRITDPKSYGSAVVEYTETGCTLETLNETE